jgi:hypothetical protein
VNSKLNKNNEIVTLSTVRTVRRRLRSKFRKVNGMYLSTRRIQAALRIIAGA